MNKKKIVALCAAFVLLFAAVGGTIAYLTDVATPANNVFSVGSVDIELTETTKINGTAVTKDTQTGKVNYTGVMPGDVLTKEPVVKNVGENEAYVRVVVEVDTTKHNGDIVGALNDLIDEKYEPVLGKNSTEMQALYDEMFDGWGISYLKDTTNVGGMRTWMKQRSDSKVLAIDSIRAMQANYWMFAKTNTFKSANEEMWATKTPDQCFGYYENNGACSGYYADLQKKGDGKLIYVFYLKLAKGESYKLFDGLKVPTMFDKEQLAIFDGLQIDINADAIQTQGFATWQDAIEALNEQHPLSYIS